MGDLKKQGAYINESGRVATNPIQTSTPTAPLSQPSTQTTSPVSTSVQPRPVLSNGGVSTGTTQVSGGMAPQQAPAPAQPTAPTLASASGAPKNGDKDAYGRTFDASTGQWSMIGPAPQTGVDTTLRPNADGWWDPAVLNNAVNAGRPVLDGGQAQLQAPNEADIRNEQMKRAQAMIDATEALFMEEMGRIKQQGRAAMGQTSSMAVGAGLAGSPFQQTMERGTQDLTDRAVQARNAERQAQIASIMAQAQGNADNQFRAAMEDFRKERQFSLDQQSQQVEERRMQAEANRKRANDMLKNLAAGGISLSEMNPAELASMLNESGMSEFEAQAIWAANSPQAGAKLQVINGNVVSSYLDPATGKPVLSITPMPAELLEAGAREADMKTIVTDEGVFLYNSKDPETSFMRIGGKEGGSTQDKLLSLAEAEKLGVPYGTTQSQAFGMQVGGQQTGVNDEVITSLKNRFNKLDAIVDGVLNEDGTVSNLKIKEDGLKAVTGTNFLGRTPLLQLGTKGEGQKFIAEVSNLISQETLQTLLDLKARGSTLGALSDSDRVMLEEAATTLGGYAIRKDGKITGFAGREKDIATEILRLKNLVKNALDRAQGTGGSQSLDTSDPQLQELLNAGYTQEQIRQFMQNSNEPFKQGVSAPVNSSRDGGVLSLGKITGLDGSPLWKWGLDIDLKKGDKVPTPVSGKVVFVGNNGGFGQQVKIKTAQGNEVWLSHLDAPGVKVGQTVSKGQVIGLGGNSGSTIPGKGGDGSHLDLTVKLANGQFMPAREVAKSLGYFG